MQKCGVCSERGVVSTSFFCLECVACTYEASVSIASGLDVVGESVPQDVSVLALSYVRVSSDVCVVLVVTACA